MANHSGAALLLSGLLLAATACAGPRGDVGPQESAPPVPVYYFPAVDVINEQDAVSMPLVETGDGAVPMPAYPAPGGETPPGEDGALTRIRVTILLPVLPAPAQAGGWLDGELVFSESVGPGAGLEWTNTYEGSGVLVLSITLDADLYKAYQIDFDTGEYEIIADNSAQWG